MGPVLKLQFFFGRNVSLFLKLLLLDKTMWFYFECFVEKLVQVVEVLRFEGLNVFFSFLEQYSNNGVMPQY